MSTQQLVKTIALVCYYAQDHLQDNWDENKDKEFMLSCTSYIVACLLAQNCLFGSNGVESSIFIKVLCDKVLNEQQWGKKASEAVYYFDQKEHDAPAWMS